MINLTVFKLIFELKICDNGRGRGESFTMRNFIA
jgi:hypothetical protein